MPDLEVDLFNLAMSEQAQQVQTLIRLTLIQLFRNNCLTSMLVFLKLLMQE